MHCQIRPLPINTRFDGIINDDGISVYDIANASQLRYAFTLMGDPDEHTPPAETIINAREYLRSYQDAGDQRDNRPKMVWDKLDASELINVADMESVWPESTF